MTTVTRNNVLSPPGDGNTARDASQPARGVPGSNGENRCGAALPPRMTCPACSSQACAVSARPSSSATPSLSVVTYPARARSCSAVSACTRQFAFGTTRLTPRTRRRMCCTERRCLVVWVWISRSRLRCKCRYKAGKGTLHNATRTMTIATAVCTTPRPSSRSSRRALRSITARLKLVPHECAVSPSAEMTNSLFRVTSVSEVVSKVGGVHTALEATVSSRAPYAPEGDSCCMDRFRVQEMGSKLKPLSSKIPGPNCVASVIVVTSNVGVVHVRRCWGSPCEAERSACGSWGSCGIEGFRMMREASALGVDSVHSRMTPPSCRAHNSHRPDNVPPPMASGNERTQALCPYPDAVMFPGS